MHVTSEQTVVNTKGTNERNADDATTRFPIGRHINNQE